MSRYEQISSHSGYRIAYGWDRPLGTFFAQVIDTTETDDDDAHMVLWRGTTARDITRAEDLAAVLAPYVELSAEELAQLRADRAATLDVGPTPLQRLAWD
jgi:hypothetical protein